MDDFENSIIAGYLYSFLTSCESAIKKNNQTSLEHKINELVASLFKNKDYPYIDAKVYEYLNNQVEARKEMKCRSNTDDKMIEVIVQIKKLLNDPFTDSNEFPVDQL